MLKLNKEEVHFLVTAEMKKEVADFLEEVDAKTAPVLESICSSFISDEDLISFRIEMTKNPGF